MRPSSPVMPESLAPRKTPAQQSDAEANAEPLDRYKAALRDRFQSPEEIYRQATLRRRTRKAGAAVFVLAAVATSLWVVDPAYRAETFTTAIGETRTHRLADGSSIALNTGSAVEVQWRLRSRRLHLTRGEAMFTVAHGVRPFIVQTLQASVRDIGTVFNVRLEGANETQKVLVTVVEGAVEVSRGQEAAVVSSGYSLFAGPGGLGSARVVHLEPVTAWQRGRLVFDGTPLDSVVHEMRRYYKAPIVLDMPAGRAADLRLSGEFDHQRIDTLLELLPTILPVRLRRLPDGQAVISATSGRGAEKTRTQ